MFSHLLGVAKDRSPCVVIGGERSFATSAKDSEERGEKGKGTESDGSLGKGAAGQSGELGVGVGWHWALCRATPIAMAAAARQQRLIVTPDGGSGAGSCRAGVGGREGGGGEVRWHSAVPAAPRSA